MIIRVDQKSPLPAYEQIRVQVAAMAASSVLPVGTRLPTIRQLAKDLQLAPGTIARAYQELERSGVLATRGRHGTFVSEPAAVEHSQSELEQAAETLAIKGHQLGMTVDQVAEALRKAFRAVTPST